MIYAVTFFISYFPLHLLFYKKKTSLVYAMTDRLLLGNSFSEFVNMNAERESDQNVLQFCDLYNNNNILMLILNF